MGVALRIPGMWFVPGRVAGRVAFEVWGLRRDFRGSYFRM